MKYLLVQNTPHGKRLSIWRKIDIEEGNFLMEDEGGGRCYFPKNTFESWFLPLMITASAYTQIKSWIWQCPDIEKNKIVDPIEFEKKLYSLLTL